MPDLIAMVEAMDPAQQAIATQVLDACSRPLTAREIEGVLRRQGLTRTRACKLAGALKGFSIIAMVGPEGGGGFETSPDRPRTPPPSRISNAIKDARKC